MPNYQFAIDDAPSEHPMLDKYSQALRLAVWQVPRSLAQHGVMLDSRPAVFKRHQPKPACQ